MNSEELYTNTWYHFYCGKRIIVSKGDKLDEYKLCFGGTKDDDEFYLSSTFRFRISGDDSVVKLNTLNAVGIEYVTKNKDYAWLSKYGDYVKTTSYWSKASWFVINKHNNNDYHICVHDQKNTYFKYESIDYNDYVSGYINPTASKENAVSITIRKVD